MAGLAARQSGAADHPFRKPVHDRLAGTVVVRAELADYGDY
jgi:hypothetical protein